MSTPVNVTRAPFKRRPGDEFMHTLQRSQLLSMIDLLTHSELAQSTMETCLRLKGGFAKTCLAMLILHEMGEPY